jgi:regulation of enolase protein 1 (concanavalin A-like superfamily)
LTGLPPHTRIEINFLLAIIDSWDGSEPGEGPGACTFCHPDILAVAVDGNVVFSEAFGYNGPVYDPPAGGLLVQGAWLGFHPDFGDAAYDMGLDPAFDSIPHMADTLTIEWFASGDGWQGGMDESWAIDNLEILLHGGTPVALDVKPQSCPNPVNVKLKGVTPVAVLGTDGLDVAQIDVDSLRLEGVAPIRSAVEDVATPYEPWIGKNEALDCTDSGPDGLPDLALKFDTQELVAALGHVEDGQVRTLTLTGALGDGTPIEGEDVVVLLSRNTASPYDDDFSSTTLDPKWHWIREDPTHWSLTDNPGYLRIVTQQKDIWQGNNSAPLLLQTFSADSFEIRTKIAMTPLENYHQGGLVIYEDDDNYVRFTFVHRSGLMIVLAQEIDADFQSIAVPAPNASGFHLRLRKDGQDYTGYYSEDGKDWVYVGQHSNVDIAPTEIGLSAFNAEWVTPIEIPADFDYFEMSP